ncbi:MAG TPA: oxygenase MpaB family protein [Acidimicrobiales bacterium]|nr:oxygenase MpaB family protein [Acidimicrobiales bacterium]
MTVSGLAPGGLRALVGTAVRAALGADPDTLDDYRTPVGDAGLFGPGSVPWLVHGDLPAMLIGGFSALMLQTLHPLAMAAVAEHSSYREDPFGRLQRTARFVAGTTFGAMPLVDQLVGEVRRVHASVRGVAADGRRYSANDPALLRWVHTAEAWSFLRSHQRYSTHPLLRGEQDRYLAEVAVIARRLGARDVPESVGQVRRYLASVRQELRATPEALEAVHFLRTMPKERAVESLAHRVVGEAAIDLLPAFARRELGLGGLVAAGGGPLPARLATRAAASTFCHVVRWSVGPSVVRAIATERAAGLVGGAARTAAAGRA